jgi:hypothetical protein
MMPVTCHISAAISVSISGHLFDALISTLLVRRAPVHTAGTNVWVVCPSGCISHMPSIVQRHAYEMSLANE